MSYMKGASAAFSVAGQVLGSGSRVSKPQGQAAGGGRKKQSGPYVGMTNKQIRQRKALERQEKAIQEGVEARLAQAGSTTPATAEASAAGEDRDGGDGTALLENPQEGHDVHPNGRGQASLNLGSVPSPDSERQAQPRLGDQARGSGTPLPDLFVGREMSISPVPLRRGGSEDDEAFGRRPYRHPNPGQQ